MPKKRKRNKHSSLTTAVARVAVATSHDDVVDEDDESMDDGIVATTSGGIITPQEVAVAVRVISQLAAEPGLLVFQSPLCRQLRQELHPLILDQLRNKYQVPDYGLAVTRHLKLSQWPEAAAALVGLKDMSSEVPKRGTIQRWVRDCDDAPSAWKMRLLSAIVGLEQETSSSTVDTNLHDPGHQLAQAAAASSSDVEVQFLRRYLPQLQWNNPNLSWYLASFIKKLLPTVFHPINTACYCTIPNQVPVVLYLLDLLE